jgi:RNA polymerase sigma factor (sigma-70 family)
VNDSYRLHAPAACVPPAQIADAVLDDAFAELYQATFPRVYAFIRSQVGSKQTAQELTGRAFLKAYKHRSKAPRGDEAAHWLFAIARTTVVDYWRTEGRREAVNVSIDELALVSDSGASPEVTYSLKERWALLLRVISMMDEDDRILLGLRFAAERTNREIAAVLSVSEAAVSMRLLRTLRRLRDLLTELGA